MILAHSSSPSSLTICVTCTSVMHFYLIALFWNLQYAFQSIMPSNIPMFGGFFCILMKSFEHVEGCFFYYKILILIYCLLLNV